ncbi:MAG: hypothetical protein ACD_72C00322G0001 [uncultured bacterium]|nr:MAG: hypothetical protein ACD_72C00322G0001 [uncultured bacterium]
MMPEKEQILLLLLLWLVMVGLMRHRVLVNGVNAYRLEKLEQKLLLAEKQNLKILVNF